MNWVIALPEIVLAALGMVILIFGVLRRRDPFQPVSMMVLGALLISAFLVVTRAGGTGYLGQFTVDSFAVLIKALILVSAALVVIVSLDYNPNHAIARFEFPVLILFAVVGMMGMASATNLMTLYLALELQSLAQYVLAGIARDDLRSSEAGLKYFVLGALASGLLLYGISLVYGFSGSMDFATLAHALTPPGGTSPGVIVGVVFVLVGLGFKVSAAPFHMWTPDVYEGAPTSVSIFFATAPKLAALALFLRTMVEPFGHMLSSWRLLIEIMAITSMIIGALGAIGQTSIKRLMAYSAISHIGYMLIGLAVGTPLGVQGALVYLLIYVFMTAGTWACIAAMRRRGRSLELISDLAGLGRTDPALALALTVFMFSLAGIPPLAGFFAKLYVFLAAVDAQMWVLAVIGVLSSVLASYYYIHVVKVMYFDAPQPAFDRTPAGIIFVAAVTGLFTLFFFIFPAPFVGAAASAAAALFS